MINTNPLYLIYPIKYSRILANFTVVPKLINSEIFVYNGTIYKQLLAVNFIKKVYKEKPLTYFFIITTKL
jgi:hypothetical protein